VPDREAAYQRILSLPIFPAMDDRDVERVMKWRTPSVRQRDWSSGSAQEILPTPATRLGIASGGNGPLFSFAISKTG